MPHSDNLYSMNADQGEDGEDYADQLSPSDGYFASSSSSSHAVPNVPNVFVPDPTLQETSELDAESKAREAEEERLLSNAERIENYYSESNYHPITSGSSRESGQSENRATSSIASRQAQFNPTSIYTYSPSSASHNPLRNYPTRTRASSVYSDAPPAYSPSPVTPVVPINQPTQSRTYSTFTSTMGVADIIENERLLERGPESIGQPHDEEVGGTPPHWSRRVRRRLPTWLGCRTLTLGLIVLVVSIGFLAGSFRISKQDDHRKTIGAQPVVQIPPNSGKEPVTAEPVTEEPVAAAPFQPSYCEDAQYRFDDQVLALNFDVGRNVTFIEDQHAHPGTSQVHVAGQINVRRLDAGGEPRLVLEIATNDKGVLLDVFTDEDAQAMKVSVPKKYDSVDPESWPCVEMRATIWVPSDGEIGVLSLGAVHLDILLLDDLSIHVTDYSRISSVVGGISSGAEQPLSYNDSLFLPMAPDYTFVPAKSSYVLDSRIIEVTTTSGRVDGNWPLYDMLGLHTTSGDIKVSITPREELEEDPKPAVLSLSSISGAVHATEPVHTEPWIPLRDYLVDIKSTSGGIHGALAFGAGIELKSIASDTALDLLPVINENKLSPAQPAQLETTTTSGTTALRILEPLWFGRNGTTASKPLNCLQAIHKSTSGDIGLRYPQAWEGYLQAETTSGRLQVRGKDVKIIKSVGGWPGSKLEAQKGPGGPGSTVQVCLTCLSITPGSQATQYCRVRERHRIIDISPSTCPRNHGLPYAPHVEIINEGEWQNCFYCVSGFEFPYEAVEIEARELSRFRLGAGDPSSENEDDSRILPLRPRPISLPEEPSVSQRQIPIQSPPRPPQPYGGTVSDDVPDTEEHDHPEGIPASLWVTFPPRLQVAVTQALNRPSLDDEIEIDVDELLRSGPGSGRRGGRRRGHREIL
ncbi:uncharacterized protein F4822DRAFT_429049 [Hypoxylon trugodes]|uniref:uncharacterized protein n=1 Tax=Hypoxylon trugodes TaxID=326681 RepID=UPI002190644D|nr:uncharacterized protein F4822DRAFT_429049 [Hypoxylon trugodes]KAI1388422.1 hypothetical protein F4822DRAFT_429049 [Hypoxylon trugodes]